MSPWLFPLYSLRHINTTKLKERLPNCETPTFRRHMSAALGPALSFNRMAEQHLTAVTALQQRQEVVRFWTVSALLSLQVKPRESYLKKYCNPKKSQGLELPDIKQYGRQILEVHLKYCIRTKTPTLYELYTCDYQLDMHTLFTATPPDVTILIFTLFKVFMFCRYTFYCFLLCFYCSILIAYYWITYLMYIYTL